MLTLCVLGFLAEEPLHAYELRERIYDLTGYTRPVSDGALYPAVNRLLRAGHVARLRDSINTPAPRHIYTLTPAGRAELLRRLSEPEPVEVTDSASFMTLLAFLHQLDQPTAQARVLRQRLAFLEQPANFFYDHSRRAEPVRLARDRFHRGMVTIATATRQASIAWLRETIDKLEREARTRRTPERAGAPV
jgi:DNA-binding PadR family transcriptional regulator